ncbi:MAG: SDR family oxidoreductase [Bacteroidota bacterium]|nr:SDR family oxidoreductase [Ferruginibacter sp.]
MQTGKRVSEKSLSQKTIVITGASSGAGRAAALRFAAHHCYLVLAARNTEVLKSVAEDCEALGATVLVVPTDVTNVEAVEALAKRAAEFRQGIDVWVNNAGVLAVGALNDTPMAVHEQVIKTNLVGYIHGAYAALPYFKKQGQGIIINNISVGAFLPVAYGSSYSASKFGLRGFFESLQSELSAFPEIHVCNMYPAFLDSPGIQHAANYTGVSLKPAPPVFDPMHLADAMVQLAEHPTRSTNVHAVTPLFKLGYALFPRLTGTIMEKVMRTYFGKAAAIAATSGNVFETVAYGNSVHGGWNNSLDVEARKRSMVKGLVVAGVLATGIFLLKAKKSWL